MNEKFNKNTKVYKFTNILGIVVRLIVIDPLNKCLYTYVYTYINKEGRYKVHG